MPDMLTLAMAMKRGGGSASWDNIKNKPVIPAAYETKKIKPQLYEIWFTDIDYKTANEYFENGGDVTVGACSAVRNGNFYGRNFDWLYNNNAEFIVHVPRIADRYASIGIATSVNTLTEEFVDSGEPSDAYGIVPFKTVDGINEFGVIANNNVVQTDKELGTIIPSGTVEEELQSTMLVRFILDHFKTAQEAVEYIQEHVKINLSQKLLNMHYEQHYMVADKDKTYLIELIGTEAVVTDMTAGANSTLAGKPYMTNFYLSDITLNSDGTVYTPYTQDATHNAIDTNGITENGAGLERYNTIAAGYASANTASGMRALVDSLKYTNAYTLTAAEEVWYSEFVGVNDLTCASPYTDYADVLTAARGMYEDRDRDEPDTWQTVHSVVYDIENKTMSVIPQESGEAIERTLEVGGGSSDAVQYVEQNLTEAQQMQARKNLGLYYKEGEETVIEWDGDITGKPEVVYEANGQTVGANVYKVSDSVPSIETIIGAKYTATFNDGVKTIESEKVGQIDSNCYTISDILGDIIIVGTAGDHAFSYTVDDIEITGIIRIPENGIYLLKFSNDSVDFYVSSLIFGSETIHKIEEKYLPDTSGAFIVTFTENNGEWTADKTFDETAAAIENGSVCLAKVEGTQSGITFESYYPMTQKLLPSETYPVGQIAFGVEAIGTIAEYILVKSGSTQTAMYYELASYDDPRPQQNGKILMSQNQKWTAVTPDFASESYVNQQISAAIGNAIGGEY